MDSPDATFDGDRGLLDTSPLPPMRLGNWPGPVSAPQQRQSPMHLVVTPDADGSGAPPTSQGISKQEETFAPPTTVTAAVPATSLQMAPNDGHVFRGEGRWETDFGRKSDSEQHDVALGVARRSSSYTDRGYLSESRLSPLTVGKPGCVKEQQPVSVHTLPRIGQLAHTYPVATDVDVGFEPGTNEQLMYKYTHQPLPNVDAMHMHTHLTNIAGANTQQQMPWLVLRKLVQWVNTATAHHLCLLLVM